MIPEPKMVDHCVNIYKKTNYGATYAELPGQIPLYKIFWIML
jgi:hypothetical protein